MRRETQRSIAERKRPCFADSVADHSFQNDRILDLKIEFAKAYEKSPTRFDAANSAIWVGSQIPQAPLSTRVSKERRFAAAKSRRRYL